MIYFKVMPFLRVHDLMKNLFGSLLKIQFSLKMIAANSNVKLHHRSKL